MSFGPSDSVVLLKVAGISKKYASLKQFKILFRHLQRCSPNANGDENMALKGPTNTGSSGPGLLFNVFNRVVSSVLLIFLWIVK